MPANHHINNHHHDDDDEPEDMHERTALFRGKSSSSSMGAPPQDKNNLAYLIFFALGIGSLLPWNGACMYLAGVVGSRAVVFLLTLVFVDSKGLSLLVADAVLLLF